jgi:hypothetical protein
MKKPTPDPDAILPYFFDAAAAFDPNTQNK